MTSEVWSLLAVPAIVVGGVLLHFVFAWSGGSRLVAVVAPVNESLWEHLKMAYWPAVAYTVAQSLVADAPGLSAARTAGFALTAVALLVLAAVSTAALPEPGPKAELTSHAVVFLMAVIAGQALTHILLSQAGAALPGRLVGAVLLALPAPVFAVATFAPPRRRLFEDPITGGYGIQVR